MITRITKRINKDSREAYRKAIVLEFLKEKHGSLSEIMEYWYFVEKLNDGKRIYLKRPTSLNKGVDFEVRIEETYFRYGKNGNVISTGNRPSHIDIINDIETKKTEGLTCFDTFCELINKVYECKDISLEECALCNFTTGFSTELILKVLKWLFIEQDITYWNRSGREMLYNAIQSKIITTQ